MRLPFSLAALVSLISAVSLGAMGRIPEPMISQTAITAASTPQRNDVTIRTLRFRDVPDGHEQDPFSAIEDYYATRLEWVYFDPVKDADSVARAKKMVRVFGGAGSYKLADWVGRGTNPVKGDDNLAIASLDLDGNPVIPPHKRGWPNKVYSGDVSNPAYFDGHLRHYTNMIDGGANALHRDEIRGVQQVIERLGGGFSPTGIAGFRVWLEENVDPDTLLAHGIEKLDTFDYGAFIRARGAPAGDAFKDYDVPLKEEWFAYWRDADLDFWTRLLAAIKDYSDGKVVFSCNNSSLQVWDSLESKFDFAISELLLGSARPGHIFERSVAARAAGRSQVFGSPKTRGTLVDPIEKRALTRKVIATAYASGSASRVPWDIFQQTTDGLGRYFGHVEDYADLYGFVRANDWHDFEVAGAMGPEIRNPSARLSRAVQIEGSNGHVYVFLNEDTGRDTPVRVDLHLVDWGQPLVPRPPVEELDYVETDSGERLYFSENGEENLKRSAAKAFSLVLSPTELGFAPSTELKLVLTHAKPFDPALHSFVAETGDLTAWVESETLDIALDEDGHYRIEIPRLDPWAILRIEPQS